MGIRISDVLYLLQQLSPLFWAADLYRIPISREDVFTGDTWGQLVAPIKVGNYDTYALIDTGTPLLFFIWRHWFEGVQPGGCKLYVFGCYECSPDVCTKGDETTFKYDNDYTVTLFRHHDTLSLGASTVAGIEFG
ncbi:hypothetical protein FOL47_000859 [Perkinsus chesapeaki]|uniref:Peptidase A1 domain-containing protein n=1 Tax=Perkinsus chesapeaki TaxID=330153 RepID=A0A7J6MKM5_PERCH|nr:hypothetical protein FOL47_000859 [Perkinsus chesapeaki]